KMAQRRQCLLVDGNRLAVRGPTEGLHPSLPEISESLVPKLPPERMVSQPLDVFSQTLDVDSLHGLDDLCVQRAPAVLQQASVGDLVSQRMLEGVLEVRKQACLV